MWLDVRYLQLYRTITPKYINKIFDIRYKIENYIITMLNTRPRIKFHNIRRSYLIMGLEEL